MIWESWKPVHTKNKIEQPYKITINSVNSKAYVTMHM